jgi:hypothetical protein
MLSELVGTQATVSGYVSAQMYKLVFSVFILSCSPLGRAYRVQVDFGAVALDSTGSEFIRFTNDGAATLDAELFLDDGGNNFQIMRESFSLGSKESLEIEIRFQPGIHLDSSNATLEVVWDQEKQDLFIFMNGEAAYDVDGDGGLDVRLGGDDCDDSDDEIYFGASDTWYDGIDSDCDGGSDFDKDGDGFEREPEGLDCDDEDNERFPGQPDGTALDSRPGVDSDCDSLVDEDGLLFGDILITEIMVFPSGTHSAFVEIYNASDKVLYLNGWEFLLNGQSVPLPNGFELAIGQSILACDDAQAADGWVCDFEWGEAVQLGSGSGSVGVGPPSLPLDAIIWDGEWPISAGASVQLDPSQFDEVANDQATAWCGSTTTMVSGDLGTPGEMNVSCDPNGD